MEQSDHDYLLEGEELYDIHKERGLSDRHPL